MVSGHMSLRDVVWRDSVLCRVTAGDLRQDHATQGTHVNNFWVYYCKFEGEDSSF